MCKLRKEMFWRRGGLRDGSIRTRIHTRTRMESLLPAPECKTILPFKLDLIIRLWYGLFVVKDITCGFWQVTYSWSAIFLSLVSARDLFLPAAYVQYWGHSVSIVVLYEVQLFSIPGDIVSPSSWQLDYPVLYTILKPHLLDFETNMVVISSLSDPLIIY